MPLLSVLMPVYNRQSFIAEAIESVLASAYKDFELIVVDDCSNDNTVSIVNRYVQQDVRIRLIVNKKNLGQFKNRNEAVRYASGQYLKYADSDDIIYPHTLQVMVEAMLLFPVAGMGFCHTIGESKKPFPYLVTSLEAFKLHYFGGGLLYTGPIGLIIKTEAFKEVKGFEEYGMPSDNHFSLKLASLYNIVALPRDLFWWRQHDEGRAFDGRFNLKNIFDHYFFNKDILERPCCPLSNTERHSALMAGRKNFARGILRHLLNKPRDIRLLKPTLKAYGLDVSFLARNIF